MEEQDIPSSQAVKARKKTAQNPRERKPPRRITPDYLRNAGKHYLERFPASTAQFTKVMQRKIQRSCKAHPDLDPAQCMAWLDDVCRDFQRVGFLNDQSYANALMHSLRLKGISTNHAAFKMRQKGIANDLIDAITDRLRDESSIDDYVLAVRWAKRKRLPPFASRSITPEKALASLARAGFDYDTAKRVLALSAEDAESILIDNRLLE